MSSSSQRSGSGRGQRSSNGCGSDRWSESAGSVSGSGTSNEKSFESEEGGAAVVDMVRMLSCSDQNNAQRILHALTGSLESCLALRRAGCIPMLIQILHPINVPTEAHPTSETKLRAAQTLKNVVQLNPDEKMKRKEVRVLKLLESLRSYIDYLKNQNTAEITTAPEKHPVPSSTALMKLSFDEDHRSAMCLLGAIHTLADLIETDHGSHGINDNPDCLTMRRYNGMTLTNLTVGDKRNKILLGTMKNFMNALVAQLGSPSEDVCQVTASVLRNLSWHASSALKASLVDSDAVKKLMMRVMNAIKESTVKAALSALWNLSAHSVANKTAICYTPNAIEFLVNLLESRTLTIVENAGGILTNISIISTTDETTREVFRSSGILDILLNHLQSPSIVVVGNACGMLWHLSTCELNQNKLIELGAVRKLKVLAGSKHERIKHGATSTLRNILNSTNQLTSTPPLPILLPLPLNKNTPQQQQPMDLRTTNLSQPSRDLPTSDLQLCSNEPLDLSLHSSKSTPIRTVSESEFGPRAHTKTVPLFLNPPLHNKTTCSYDSPKSFNSCPEFLRFIQPAHKSTPIDFSKGETQNEVTNSIEDTTINYSLHFTEPEDVVTNKNEDTVKTYYCEGTPLNFSTSNSMNDLTQVERPTKLKPIIETETADDLPRKYYTESTPATFSRASSLSSIASNLQGGENKAEYLEEIPPKILPVNGSSGKEKGKRNVTFSASDTPLMFSRTSSVNSLDSVEINFEDTGSVISDFSRRASEAVSPSELPDSPREIRGSSEPLSLKAEPETLTLTNTKDEEIEMDTVKVFGRTEEYGEIQSPRNLSPLTIDDAQTEIHILEPVKFSKNTPTGMNRGDESDEMKVFGIEGTPWKGVSTATSLSDLVTEMEKEEVETILEEKPPSSPPPPLPPKPNSDSSKPKIIQQSIEACEIHQNDTEPPIENENEIEIEVPEHPTKLPKSKSELSQLNTKAIKVSTSYHENLKRENQLDPELAALIMKGKSRVRGSKTSTTRNQNGKLASLSHDNCHGQESKIIEIEQQPVISVESKFLGCSPGKNQSSSKSNSPEVRKCEPKINNGIQQSTTSMASEWNEETLSLSVQSLSISTAFKLAQSTNTNSIIKDEKGSKIDLKTSGLLGSLDMSKILLQSTISSVEPPTEMYSSNPPSSTGWKKCNKLSLGGESCSNLANQKPPPEYFDLDSSMVSVASLKTEIASLADSELEEGMKDLSIGGDTYTLGCGGSDLTDADESFFDDTESLEVNINSTTVNQETKEKNSNNGSGVNSPQLDDRFLTYTTKKHSPRQKRREDPGRYLTRTISPHTPPRDTNGNHSPSPNLFSTFRVDRTPRILKPVTTISVTSNESSPNTSPKGIRGRRKILYSSLPPHQKKIGPPIPPPKPKILNGNTISGTPINGTAIVRPTRTSELRAANSRESSSPKNSSKNSSTNSLSNIQSSPPIVTGYHQLRKTPPKPPVRTTTVSKNFSGISRTVRTSNSSIGFSRTIDDGDTNSMGSHSTTLPRSLKVSSEVKNLGSKVGKLSNFWNQLMKPKTEDNSSSAKNSNFDSDELPPVGGGEKKKFGFHFGRKKKSNWISTAQVPKGRNNEEKNGATVNYNSSDVAPTTATTSTFSGDSFASTRNTSV